MSTPSLAWSSGNAILTLAAQRTLRSSLEQLIRTGAEWVVVVRTNRTSGEVFRYAWRASELQGVAEKDDSRLLNETLEVALSLHEYCASNESRRRREQPRPPYGAQGPASTRTVDLDANGSVVAVGEPEDSSPSEERKFAKEGERHVPSRRDIGGRTGKSVSITRPKGRQVSVGSMMHGRIDRLYRGQPIFIKTIASGDSGRISAREREKIARLKNWNARIGLSGKPVATSSFEARKIARLGGIPAQTDGLVRGQPVFVKTVPAVELGRNSKRRLRKIARLDKLGAQSRRQVLSLHDFDVINAHEVAVSVEDMPALRDRPLVNSEPEPKNCLSAQAPAELKTGARGRVDVRLELEPEADRTPLSHRITADTSPDLPMVVQISVENDAIRVLGDHELQLPPPRRGQPQQAFFDIEADRCGSVRLAVTFRQGGSELGCIGLAVEVVDSVPAAGTSSGRSTINAPNPCDDDLLDLLIEQRNDNGRLHYEYRLHSETLGLNFLTLHSQPLLDSDGATAVRVEQFIERIYSRVTREMKTFDDLKALQREVRALGAGLSDELFAPEVVRVLWPQRRRIGLIKITSWEPLIPWELLRLREPDSGEIDDRFFAEYGLVRALPGEAPARKLPLDNWRWLAGDYPMATHAPAGDMSWFQTLALQHGLHATQVPATANALFDTLAEGQFDVLHVACHAESPFGKPDNAVLIIGDEATPGGSAARLIEADTATVKAEANLRARRPLVFLNACESGRVGAQLTAWGGWPEVFIRAGAGAFVGTAWAVRDKPATVFASTFFEMLLNHHPLHEAASAARQAAKKLGDASWLAFKVYGDPRSRRA